MKRLSVLVVGALLASQMPAFAHPEESTQQEGMHKPDHKGKFNAGEWQAKRLERLTKKLELTADQQDKVKKILNDEEQKMKAIHEQAKALRDQSDSQIQGILTDQQKKTYIEFKEKREKKLEDRKSK